jgi:hypothetical protein
MAKKTAARKGATKKTGARKGAARKTTGAKGATKKTAARKGAAKKTASAGRKTSRKTSGATKGGATKRSAGKRSAAKRELIDTGTDKRFVRRNAAGQIKESDDVGRSLSVDQRRAARTRTRPGQGDKGDR